MLKVKAYAKINLILKVLNKRRDGYHNIFTLMQNIELADTLTFSNASDITIESNLNIKPEDNLVYKAAKSLAKFANVSNGASIYLDKKIPVEAGLGGGSSDAAATLIALNKLWNTMLKNEDLKKIAVKIGADVSFFIEGGSALVEGVGEKVQKLKPIDSFNLVVAKPSFGIRAKAAYEGLSLTSSSNFDHSDLLIKKIENSKIKVTDYANDLEKSVLDKYSKIQEYFKIGYENNAMLVMLSGSGSAFFALAQEDDLIKIAKAWQGLGLDVYRTKTIDRGISFES